MIARMGAYPSRSDHTCRPATFIRFRTAARAVIAIQRMLFLVKKSQRVSVALSSDNRANDSTSRLNSDGVIGHMSQYDRTVQQAPSNVRASRPGGNSITVSGASSRPTDRYLPRADQRIYDRALAALRGDKDEGTGEKRSILSSRETFSRREDDEAFTHRSRLSPSRRSPRTVSPIPWSETRTTSVPLRRDTTITDYSRPPLSPPVRDIGATRRGYNARQHLDLIPRHSSPPSRGYDDVYGQSARPLSPSGASSVGSSQNGLENGDHSLNLYIHRLESLQNRLGAINRGAPLLFLLHFIPP